VKRIRVRKLRWRPFELHLSESFESSWGVIKSRAGILVSISDSEGFEGFGEVNPMPEYTGGAALADVARQFEGISSKKFGLDMFDFSRKGSLLAWNACKMALLDAEARKFNLALHVETSAGSRSAVITNGLLANSTLGQTLTQAGDLVSSGYSTLKLKIGLKSLDEDIETIRQIRILWPDIKLRLDVNGAWSLETAKTAVKKLLPYDIELIEQPTDPDDLESLAEVHTASSIPIAADEAIYKNPEKTNQIVRTQAVDILVLKPMLIGGIRETIGLAEWASTYEIESYVTTTFDSAIGVSMAIHAAASLPWQAAHGLSTGKQMLDDVAVTPIPVKGEIQIPKGPGLGISPDIDMLEMVAIASWQEIIYG
jgi:o-succinylbenzoate synthase